jgi:F-type H+-transporting ATPase subunit b
LKRLLRNTRKTDSLRRPGLACSSPIWCRAFAAFALLGNKEKESGTPRHQGRKENSVTRVAACALLIAGLAAFTLSAQETKQLDKDGAKGTEQAEEAEKGTLPNELLWKWANFAILAGVLGWLGAKHLGPYFTSRSAEIRNGIEEAQKVKAEAETRAADIEKRIENLVAEVESMRGKSREEISAEGERISAETAQQISRLQAQAENEIAYSAKVATVELKAQAAALALKMAEQQIRGRMGPQTQEVLVESFLSDLRAQESKTKAISN